MKPHSSRFLHTVRRFISLLTIFSPSGRITEILLWPISRRLFGRYWEIVLVAPKIRMMVYGDMEDMVNKILMNMSDYKELAWEPVTARFVCLLSQQSKSVAVAGSHIGYYPLVVSSVNPNALVYAFEPNPKNYDRMVTNILLNSSQNIKPSRLALGAVVEERKMFFDFGQSSFIDSSRQHSSEGMVKITTLDDFFSGDKADPDLMIFDAEGFELNILKGGAKVINHSKPNIIFEINPKVLKSTGHSTQELCDFVKDLGYSIFIIDDDYHHSFDIKDGTEIKLLPYAEDVLKNVSFVNAFATIDPNRFSPYIKNV